MTVFKYYNKRNISQSKDIDKDSLLKDLTVTVWEGDLNNPDKEGKPSQVYSETFKPDTLQEAVNVFKAQFIKLQLNCFDFKSHSKGAFKFYSENKDGLEILTYLKMNYKGNEIIDFDMEELGFYSS